jgi:acyl dehydratase
VTQGATYPLFFEDYECGTEVCSAAREITEADLAAYVELAGFDEDVFTSASAAQASLYRGRIVPGSMTFAFAEGLLVRTGVIRGVGLAFLGVDAMRIPHPVRPGDTIRVVAVCTAARRSRKNADAGVVTTHHRVLNQREETVMEFDVTRLVRARQATS